jgi:molybdopterin synthase sulfur carrier subunit
LKLKVRAFGVLMETLGREKTIELEDGSKLKDLINILNVKTNISKGYQEKYDREKQILYILVNGRNIRTIDGVETILKEGDTVTFFPPFAGG